MSKSSPSGTTTTTNTNTPWAGQQPYLQQGYASAANLMSSDPMQYYPGQTVAQPTAPQTTAINLQTQRALDGSPVTNASQQYLTTLESGSLLDAGNPEFNNMVGQIAQAVEPQVDSSFAGAGRTGSGAQANAFESALTNAASNLGYQNYNSTLQNMTAALPQAIPLANQDYTDISQLNQAGTQEQSNNQANINEDIARFTGNQQLPWEELANYTGAIGGAVPGGGTTATPYYTNTAGNVLGAVTAGSSLANSASSAKSGKNAGSSITQNGMGSLYGDAGQLAY